MAKKPNITLNANFESLRTGFDNVVSLDGSTPNAMQADFDLNGNDILNAGNIFVDGVNLLNLLDNVTVSPYAPSGGNDGDVWFKVS